jgi:chromosome segregation ATPase
LQGSSLPVVAAAALAAGGDRSNSDVKKVNEEEKISWFWRIFGGTILSMVALGTLTLYNNISTNLSDLRRELNQEREARAELIRKQDFVTLLNNQGERLRLIEVLKADMEGLKERVAANSTTVDGIKKEQSQSNEALRKELEGLRKELIQSVEGAKRDTATTIETVRKEQQSAIDALKKEVAAVETLRERLTMLEALKKEVAVLEIVRERLTQLTMENKTLRDDMNKLQQEIERNKAADQERKRLRDEQYKQIDQTLKELQKELQTTREKLARLEAALSNTGPTSTPPATPMTPPVAK